MTRRATSKAQIKAGTTQFYFTNFRQQKQATERHALSALWPIVVKELRS
jgi:hypothetical protein